MLLLRRRQEFDLEVERVSECARQKSRAVTHRKDADFARDQRRRRVVIVREGERESAQSVTDRADEGEISYRSHHKQQKTKSRILDTTRKTRTSDGGAQISARHYSITTTFSLFLR